MKKLTARSRINLYWTTDPNYLGYGKKEQWKPLESKPDLVGTPRTIIEQWNKEKQKCGLNSGVYYGVRFYLNGHQIEETEIIDFVYEMDHPMY